MQPPATPEDEAQRMAALRATNALFTPSEERFDRVTRIASQVLETPIALVTLVADKLQWFKSIKGLDVNETPRDISFCGHAILSEDTFVVGNAARDPRFADNPLVSGSPFIRAYAGHPLHAADGSRVGTLCVIDHKPRKFKKEHLATLRDLAAIAESELERDELRGFMLEKDELKRKVAIDNLTRLWNQTGVTKLLDAELARAIRGTPTCVAIARVRYGGNIDMTPAGQAVLKEIAARIRRAVRAFDVVGYCGGGEFIVVFSNCSLEVSRTVCERIRSLVEYENIATPIGLVKTTVSVGLALCSAGTRSTIDVASAADSALSRAESLGGNRVVVHDAGATGIAPLSAAWTRAQ